LYAKDIVQYYIISERFKLSLAKGKQKKKSKISAVVKRRDGREVSDRSGITQIFLAASSKRVNTSKSYYSIPSPFDCCSILKILLFMAMGCSFSIFFSHRVSLIN